jgi:hypothetical protein
MLTGVTPISGQHAMVALGAAMVEKVGELRSRASLAHGQCARAQHGSNASEERSKGSLIVNLNTDQPRCPHSQALDRNGKTFHAPFLLFAIASTVQWLECFLDPVIHMCIAEGMVRLGKQDAARFTWICVQAFEPHNSLHIGKQENKEEKQQGTHSSTLAMRTGTTREEYE